MSVIIFAILIIIAFGIIIWAEGLLGRFLHPNLVVVIQALTALLAALLILQKAGVV